MKVVLNFIFIGGVFQFMKELEDNRLSIYL